MRVKIEVTEHLISRDRWTSGLRCETCPVARAINRHLKRGFFVAVDPENITVFARAVRGEGARPTLRTPARARAFMAKVDGWSGWAKVDGWSGWSGLPRPKPFSFVLNLPKAVLKGQGR
jgi:hypothetical protein